MRRGATVWRGLVLCSAAACSLTVLGASAAAADEPPGWVAQDPSSGLWAAFTVDPSTPLATGRATFEPVTVERHGNVSGLLAAFSNWDTRPNQVDPLGSAEHGWPLTFTAGAVELERVPGSWCDYTATKCDYRVVHDGAFEVHGGTPPLDPVSGLPDLSVFPAAQTITLAPAKALNVGFNPDVKPTPGAAGGAGHITLDASGVTNDELDPGGPLVYHWTIVNLDHPGTTFSSNIGPTVDVTIDKDGTYCVQLSVTASDGFSQSTLDCTDLRAARFLATNFAPAPAPAPAAAPEPGIGSGSGTGGDGGTGGTSGGGGIVFANPVRRAPTSLGSINPNSPAVIWLWRPDWYQPSAAAPESIPQTSGRPNLKGRHEIVITRPGPSGASAGPWLAGMGFVGLAGGSWIVSRRRRLRMLDLEL